MDFVQRAGGLLNAPTLSFSLHILFLLPKHMDTTPKDLRFPSNACSSKSVPPACSQGIIWHSGISNTKCGRIPKQNAELSLFAHTGTPDT